MWRSPGTQRTSRRLATVSEAESVVSVVRLQALQEYLFGGKQRPATERVGDSRRNSFTSSESTGAVAGLEFFSLEKGEVTQ